MSNEETKPPAFSLKRWSQRKVEAARGAPAVPAAPPTRPAPARAAVPAPPPDVAVESAAPIVEAGPLPPIESLTIDSDFSGFLEASVDEGLRQRALRQLFRDPHFNAMDGLDVYIGDYSTPDPMSPEMVRELVQGRYIFDPPKTRLNANGVVEDVPADDAGEERAALPESAPAASALPAPVPEAHDADEPEGAAGSLPVGSGPAPR